MAQMAAAVGAGDLGADHAVTVIDGFVDGAAQDGLVKARPAATGIELGFRREEGCPAAHAAVSAIGGFCIVFTAEGVFGSFLPADGILLRCQSFAPEFFILIFEIAHIVFNSQ